MAKSNPLKLYQAKREFTVTPEPLEGGIENVAARSFVIQKHWATRLHYDLRLELDGTMKSWAIPKGPSLDPKDKRMAVHVEDHPISYNSFEGQIPKHQYGAGKVIIWDKGVWIPVGDPLKGYRDGNLKFELHGHKLQGRWVLVRIKESGNEKKAWLLIKEKDAFSRCASEFSVVDEMPDSVKQLDNPPKEPQPKSLKNSLEKSAKRKAIPKGAIKALLPNSLSPPLATLLDTAPGTDDWLYEIKFDGYRILTRVDGKRVQLITRNGNNWTNKLPTLAHAIAELNITSGWLDGEIIVPDENGIPNFQLLQNAFDTEKTHQIIYYLFDLPYYHGYDLRTVPLIERRSLLQSLIKKSNSNLIRYSENFDATVNELMDSACHIGLEGVIGKRRDSSYISRRNRDWIKLKCQHRQEFVIGGFTDPRGTRQAIGSLLLGVHDDEGNLLYVGNVGTGLNDQTLVNLRKQLDAIASDKNPFASETDASKTAHWVKPKLLAEVSFSEWTQSGRIRHSVFHGLRTDRKAKDIAREKPALMNDQPELASRLPYDFNITHAERVIDQSSGLTKLDLIRFYALVAPLMMPHLKGRPTSLVRAPHGVDGQLFFQKHMETHLDGMRLLDRQLDPKHAPLIEIAQPIGLLSAAQMNVIEFHTWNGVKTNIERPDRMTFDLDPGEGVPWEMVQESTLLMGSFLTQLGLQSFVKTSGGNGLHVIVPLKKHADWDTVKDFSHAIVNHMATTLPMRFVAKSGPKNRVRKIFIDYLRNGFGATTVAAWSVRARPGLSVSVPVAWEEVEKLHSSKQWTVANIHTRLDQGNEPWDSYARSKQNITAAMKLLG